MSQLSLNITPCVSYDPAHFIVHQGVRSLVDATALVQQPLSDPTRKKFEIIFAVGGPRSGKTHFSVYLADRISKAGRYPRLLEAAPQMEWKQILGEREISPADVFIVDDAHRYLNSLLPGSSGDLVSFIEALRVRGASMVWLSSEDLDRMPFDEHVRSRLLPGVGPRFSSPAADEMSLMLDTMARQRGLALTERKVEYLERRLPREIRQLEEYLDRVQYIAHVTGKPVRFPLLGDAL